MNVVSVIIVNFNGGPLLVSCVRSIFASTVPVEVIVSDNQSSDSSINDLRRCFAGVRNLTIIENPGNFGFAKANNIALPYAKGDHILFLNPDCIIEPDTIEKMLAGIKERPNVGMAGCLILNPDGTEQAGCRRSIPTPWRTFLRMTRLSYLGRYSPHFESYIQTGLPIPEHPIPVEAISGAFMLVRRQALEQVGPMDEGYFMHCEDLDWCMRFHQAGMTILFIPEIAIMHVGGVCSASRPISVEYYKHVGMVRFYRKFFRYQYPALLMWLVMLAIGVRFTLRVLGSYFWPSVARRNEHAERLIGQTPASSISSAVPAATKRRVAVTGATSLIGDYLIPKLLQGGYEVDAFSRKPPDTLPVPGLRWKRIDISSVSGQMLTDVEALIHLAPLSTLPPLLKETDHHCLRRIIAFSSTSLFTKMESSDEQERAMARGLKGAEDCLREFSNRNNIHWTVFRPTLVYHLGRDKNITTIAEFIRRFRLVPLVGNGTGLRQPVHAEDLADACLSALKNPKCFDKAYNLSGGETLTYRAMVERLAGKLGRTCRIINIPLPALRLFLRGMSFVSRYRHLTPEMANRINRDMCFDHRQATADFGYAPRCFMEDTDISVKVAA
jgi:GT2 family glycosyltransferase/nucleoside-diphosphate-sugar epimerase